MDNADNSDQDRGAPDSGVESEEQVQHGDHDPKPDAPVSQPIDDAKPTSGEASELKNHDLETVATEALADSAASTPPNDSESVATEGAMTEGKTELDLASLREALTDRRASAVATLFGEQRSSDKSLQHLVQEYVDAVTAAAIADVSVADEVAVLCDLIQTRHEQALEQDGTQARVYAEKAQLHREVYDTLFAQLDVLLDAITVELGVLQTPDEVGEAAPEKLASALLNHRKGVEIVQRMLARVKDRRKELGEKTDPSLSADPVFVDRPTELEEVAEFVRCSSQRWHDNCDANFHKVEELKKTVAACDREVSKAVKNLLSAVDGIDAGLANEQMLREELSEYDQEFGPLIAKWFALYHSLDSKLAAFFEATCLEPASVEPGSRFDPETMEPQGTVKDPDKNNEDVASVLRRGFSLNGRQMRPTLVEVVMND
jgi:molecular chaperone GrpE (heat shock protein)